MGYNVEVHFADTKDGYKLALERIPHNKMNVAVGQPVLLLHGLFCSSYIFALNHSSLGKRNLKNNKNFMVFILFIYIYSESHRTRWWLLKKIYILPTVTHTAYIYCIISHFTWNFGSYKNKNLNPPAAVYIPSIGVSSINIINLKFQFGY